MIIGYFYGVIWHTLSSLPYLQEHFGVKHCQHLETLPCSSIFCFNTIQCEKINILTQRTE